MNQVRFTTIIGEDQVIRPPAGVNLTPGVAEVIILQGDASPELEPRAEISSQEHLFDRLANLAKKLGVDTSTLPTDLAENHDHYLHGLPKGIDKE